MGARIRAARLHAGLTIRDLAARVGSTETTIRNWESGNVKNPRVDLAVALERVLDVDLGIGFGALTGPGSATDPGTTPDRDRPGNPLADVSTGHMLAELGRRIADLEVRNEQLVADFESAQRIPRMPNPGRGRILHAARTRDPEDTPDSPDGGPDDGKAQDGDPPGGHA